MVHCPEERDSLPLLFADALVIFISALALSSISAALLTGLAFRTGLVLSALSNEWGHVLVGLRRGCGRRALNAQNLTGSRPVRSHLLALVPFIPDRRGDLTVWIRGLNREETWVVRVRGFWVGALLTALFVFGTSLLAQGAPAAARAVWLAFAVGSSIALVAGFVSDLTDLTAYARMEGVMACGNVTLLGRLLSGERSAFPERGQRLLRDMASISQMRGAQSGGGAVQIRRGDHPGHVVRKSMNSKRGDLADRLSSMLTRAAGGARAFGDGFVVQAHVRYATAGLSSTHEAHPFCFVDPAQRGARRILRWVGGRPSIVDRIIETTLTHNGDMDGLRFRGRLLAYPDLGQFLERVLGVPNRWTGDSPLLAGAIELFLTQGMWVESLRLAYQLTVAPEPPDLAQVAPELEGGERTRALRHTLASHPAPTLAALLTWAQLAERAWLGGSQARAEGSSGQSFRQRLAERLAAEFELASVGPSTPEQRQLFSRAAVDAFLDNDLFVATRKVAERLEGTFGCVVTSTLEPGCAVAFSRGQPLSLGFHRGSGLVAVVSERVALKVRTEHGPAFTERLDLDVCHGEIARVELLAKGRPQLTLFSVAEGREYGWAQLELAGRIVPLVDNPLVSALPPAVRDRAASDIADIAPLLRAIRAAWQSESSTSRQTAAAFARALLGSRDPRLLVVGVTNDLWLAQQFVQNLQLMFPGIRAEAKSSNQVLKEIERTSLSEETVVLAVSQSGQDFPTLAALLSLQERAGYRGSQSFFVLSGEADTLMAEAVGQRYHRGARFSCRVFDNRSGFRPSEAATATVNATHHTFVELLLFMANQALDPQVFPDPPHGFSLAPSDLEALRTRRDFTVDRQAPRIAAEIGAEAASEMTRKLHGQARRWSWHVLEGILASLLVVLVLQLNLQFRLGLEPSRLFEGLPWSAHTPLLFARLLAVIGIQCNIAFYAFLTPCLVWLFRSLQGRPTLHRQGTRELVIGDTRYVHQVVWFLAKKLFSLSYGFASIKPYSADNQDELVLTHEPVRGTLALFGLPQSGRRYLRAREAAAAMTAKQFNNSRCVGGSGAEVVTISHSARPPGHGFHAHLSLPHAEIARTGPELDALLEDMFDSWERMLGMQVFLNSLAERVSKFRPFGYDRSRTKDQVFAATTAAPVSAAALYELLAQTRQRFGHFDRELPFGANQPGLPRVRTLTWPAVEQRRPSSTAA